MITLPEIQLSLDRHRLFRSAGALPACLWRFSGDLMAESKLDTQTTDALAIRSGLQIPHLRWLIIGLLFLPTLINYIDRLTSSVLAPVITRDLNLSNTEFGGIVPWFVLAYTISQRSSGRRYDPISTRPRLAISITVWSLPAAPHAFA